ncbi:hypothetical protein HanIR_Chr17g0848351 [Helianthus annuus]|nr:hypothetical protein HanIR_Chr17g0848351 [Helianthus annuus]
MRYLIEPRCILINLFLSYSLPLRFDENEINFLFVSVIAIFSLIFLIVSRSLLLLAYMWQGRVDFSSFKSKSFLCC